jgi:hypothetical protein
MITNYEKLIEVKKMKFAQLNIYEKGTEKKGIADIVFIGGIERIVLFYENEDGSDDKIITRNEFNNKFFSRINRFANYDGLGHPIKINLLSIKKIEYLDNYDRFLHELEFINSDNSKCYDGIEAINYKDFRNKLFQYVNKENNNMNEYDYYDEFKTLDGFLYFDIPKTASQYIRILIKNIFRD